MQQLFRVKKKARFFVRWNITATYIAVIFRHSCLYVFTDEGSCYIFSTRNNSCEFLAFYGVILQSVIKPYFPHVFLLSNPFNFLQFYWLLLFALGSSDKLHIRAKFSISLCTENSMLNATETAVCNFPDFYWCQG